MVATRHRYTRPPTAYALTIYNFPTSLTLETRQACPGSNQVPNAQLSGGELPRSDDWTIHMGHVVIKRGGCSNIPESNGDGAFAPSGKPLNGRLNPGCGATRVGDCAQFIQVSQKPKFFWAWRARRGQGDVIEVKRLKYLHRIDTRVKTRRNWRGQSVTLLQQSCFFWFRPCPWRQRAWRGARLCARLTSDA